MLSENGRGRRVEIIGFIIIGMWNIGVYYH